MATMIKLNQTVMGNRAQPGKVILVNADAIRYVAPLTNPIGSMIFFGSADLTADVAADSITVAEELSTIAERIEAKPTF